MADSICDDLIEEHLVSRNIEEIRRMAGPGVEVFRNSDGILMRSVPRLLDSRKEAGLSRFGRFHYPEQERRMESLQTQQSASKERTSAQHQARDILV